MIPVRHRATLPPGHWWIAHSDHGHLIVTVSTLVPPGGRLEQELVREAVRAWKQRKGLVLLPAPIAGGAGIEWLVRQARKPAVAAGTAVAAAGVAFGAVTLLPSHTPHRPPVVAAPPARTAPAPRHQTVPHRPAKPAPQRPGRPRPQVPQPHVVADVSTSRVSVHPARLPVRLPVRVPPVHWTPPKVPDPPMHATPPPPVSATDCRLVRLDLKLVRICV